MSDPPLDLRSLADIDAPDVVRGALRTFRRRTLVRSLWGLLAGVVAVVIIYAAVQPHSLPARITSASLVYHPPGATWQFGDERIALADVAKLGDKLGLHLVVVAPSGSTLGAQTSMQPKGTLDSLETGSVDHWYEVSRPKAGIIHVSIFRTGSCQTINRCTGSLDIDLAALGVPDEIWR